MIYSFGNKQISVVLKRKFIKKIYFRYRENKLIVSLPYYISDKHILKLINKEKIKIDELIKKGVNQEIDESKIWLKGSLYDIIFVDDASSLSIKDNKVYIKNKQKLEKYIQELSINHISNLYEMIKKEINLGYNYRLKLRKMKSKWGVCNNKSKTITLNTRLIEKDDEIIKYVIIHELCHTVVFNHSKEFWNEVYKYCPNYKEIRKRMRRTNEEII